jgi:capsular exopolysaccharide synthesis family protein
LPNEFVALPEEQMEYAGKKQAALDPLAILLAVLRRWKLIAVTTVSALVATYGVMRLVPPVYKSTAEILVYDPQRQIDSAIQKPISPFVDALSYDAMSTEINVLKSKSVLLRVASELHLDEDPDLQAASLILELLKRAGLFGLVRIFSDDRPPEPTKAEKLDRAADVLLASVEAWSDAYIIFISVSAHNPVLAQGLSETIAKDYLASQREARQEALQHVAGWLKGRVDELRSRVLGTEASIEELKAQSGIPSVDSDALREQQIAAFNKQLITAREQIEDQRSRLEQARRIIDGNGDIQSIPELTASSTLTKLRQQETELSSRLQDLQAKLGDRHVEVIAAHAALATIEKQISAEAGHILGNMQNSYDIALRQEQSIEARLQGLTSLVNSKAYTKLQQLRRVADADRSLYESYLSQYNDISERRTLQDASARIISPATLPKSPSSSRRKMFYGAGAMLGFGSGILIALLLELLRPGVQTGAEIEKSFGLPVVGVIPGIWDKKHRGDPRGRLLNTMISEPLSQLSQAVNTMRIGLELSSARSKVILVTSAIPNEGKSTTAMLLAASSSRSGKRAILVDTDLHQHSASAPTETMRLPGLAELLQGKTTISEVITRDPVTKTYVISAGSAVSNAADCLLSERMRDLIAVLRDEFDYVVIDAPPLLPVLDSLVLATIADKVLMVVAWDHTPRASISEAFKILQPEAHRVAGIVLNKVDLTKMSDYGYTRYRYGLMTSAQS